GLQVLRWGQRLPALQRRPLARPWIGGPALVWGAFARGMSWEIPTQDQAMSVDGTAVLEVEETGAPGADGPHLAAQFCGASVPARALELDADLPPPGAGLPGLLHLCSLGAAQCTAPAVAGRGERHVVSLRFRSARSPVEPGVRASALPAAGCGGAAHGGAAAAPGRLAGAAARHAAAAASAAELVGSRGGRSAILRWPIGLREGAPGLRARPKVRGHLQATIFGHRPIHGVGERTARALQTLATAPGPLELGSLASAADTLMRRAKALEVYLDNGNWNIASELEVHEGSRPTPASRSEQETARRAVTLRRRLEEAKARVACAAGPRGGRRRARRQPSGFPRAAVAEQAAAAGAAVGPLCRRAAAADARPARLGRPARPRAELQLGPQPGRPPPSPQRPPGLQSGRPRRDRRAMLNLEPDAQAVDWGRPATDAAPKGGGSGKGREAGASAGSTSSAAAAADRPRLAGAPAGSLEDADGIAGGNERRHAANEPDEKPASHYDDWRKLVGAAHGVFRRPLDAGPILKQLMRAFLGSLGQRMKEFQHCEQRNELDPRDLEALQARLMATVAALNWETGRRRRRRKRCCAARPNAAQWSALQGLARRIYTALSPEPVLADDIDWIKDRQIAHNGSEVSTPLLLTLEQRRRAATSTRDRASEGEWHIIVGALYERGMAGPIDEAATATRNGQMLVSSAFGVARAHDPPIACEGGASRPAPRLIINFAPANARQSCIAGDAPEMLTMGQLNQLAHAPSGTLPWSGANRKAFFYVFRAPPARWPHMAPGPSAPARLAGNMLRRSSAAPRGLAPGTEIVRRRPLSFGCEAPLPAGGFVYIDNLEIAEAVSAEEAEALKGSAPPLLNRARERHEAAGPPGSPGTNAPRSAQAATLGELIDGVEGTRRPPLGYVTELTSLTFWALGKRRASRRLMPLFGRWARAQCFRRPLAAARVNARRWLAAPRAGGWTNIGAAEDRMMAMALSVLSVAEIGLEVDSLAAASDASEAAGAAVHWKGQSPRGEPVAARRARPPSPAREGGAALISAFAGIDCARGIFEIPGLAPAAHLSFEVDADAARIAQRAYGSIEHLGDITSQLAGHAMRIIAGLKREMPEAVVDFLDENLSTMAEGGAPQLNATFGRAPLELKDLLPSLEAADLCPLDPAEFAAPQASSAAKTAPARFEALRRSLIGNLFQREADARLLAHWAAQAELQMAAPTRAALHASSRSWAGGRRRWAGDFLALREGREAVSEAILAAARRSSEGGTAAAGAAQPGPPPRLGALKADDLEAGEPVPRGPGRPPADAAALYVSWLARQLALLDALEEPRGRRLLCHCPPAAPCHADVLREQLAQRGPGRWWPFSPPQRAAAALVMMRHHSGADLRVDANVEALGKVFPRQEVNAELRHCKTARQMAWHDRDPHISVPKREASLMALRWRAQAIVRHVKVYLHLLGSMFSIGVLSKHRSSSRQPKLQQ
ncbi:unnamed protein product, partial [Prorocentrum cordatum]